MITLYQFPAAFGLPNPSPFCFKVETYLRMTGEPYEVKRGNPQKAPKGKLPFIKDGGVVVADSAHILQHLVKTRGDKLDQGLSPADRALGHLIRRTIEEGLYFCLVYARWVDDVGFAAGKEELFGAMPAVARALFPSIARRMVRKQVYAQGTARHAQEDIYAMLDADVTALADILGEKPYFLGQSPTSVDATAYAHLALLLWSPLSDAATAPIKKHPNLVAYCERMKARYFP
ncbi:MAG: glutathione S-transferase family protein [Polyangiaceae bacterium]